MRIKLNRIITSELFMSILYYFVRGYSWTFRLTVENEKEWMDYLESGRPVLLCGWHQQFFSIIRHFPKYKVFNPSLMISQSSDGEIAAGITKRAGGNPVRGSSSSGGSEALKEMIANLKESKLAVHIVDGPRGPLGKVKAGVIRLAHVTGAVIVPYYVFTSNGWYFNSWDKFLLPKPFSRVLIRFGEMIKFEKVKDKEIFEEQRKHLEDIMLPALKL